MSFLVRTALSPCLGAYHSGIALETIVTRTRVDSFLVQFSIQHKRMGNKRPFGYPSDVGNEEWRFVAPYLALSREDAPQREYSLRAVFNGLRYIVKTGNQWRMMPQDLPPWPVVYQ